MVIITGLRGCALAFANGLGIRVKYALVSDHVGGRGRGPIPLTAILARPYNQVSWSNGASCAPTSCVPCPGISCHRLTFQVGTMLHRCGHINDTKPKTRISERLWPRRTVP